MSEILINLANISVNLSGRLIFDQLDWEIQDSQRIGLVGPNGAGKSTLMKLMAAELTAESGTIFRRSKLTWGRLEQEPLIDSDNTVMQEALCAMPELTAINQKLATAEAQMGHPDIYSDPEKLEAVMAAHTKLLDQFEQLDGSRFESKVKDTLTRLGFPQERWEQPVKNLSGGEKKLILLAQLLIRNPDILLLDEPDNHLDVPAKRRLEKLIHSYKGCIVIISHDRYLLDEIATHIAELENGKLTLYNGNYSAYTTERELRRLRQQQLYAAQQKEITRLEAAIARFELWASMVIDERHIKQARNKQRQLDEMDKIDKVVEQKRMKLEMNGWRGSNKVIELVDVSRTLPTGRTLWDNLNTIIWHGERVGLVGPNGAGKSMLLKQLLDPENVPQGKIKIGPSSQIGYYAQEHETLDFGRTLLAEIRRNAVINESDTVAFLNRFLFSYDQIRGKVGNLSGGERSRLQLAKLVLEKPNLLLLDEPTNNLDITSIEVLEETLNEFVGTVIIISHDRYFLDKTVDRIIELRHGRLTEFTGGYTDYLDATGHSDV